MVVWTIRNRVSVFEYKSDMNGFDGVTTGVWGGTNEEEGTGSISWGEGVRIRTCV